MALRAVTFDLWGTLLLDTPELDERRTALRVQDTARLLRGWGFPYRQQHVADAFEQARALWSETRRLGAELSARQKLVTWLGTVDGTLLQSLGSRQLEELAMLHAQALMKLPPTVASGADELVRGLNARGLRLGLIANTGVTPGFSIRRLLQAAGFGNCFSAFTFSDELGAGKPTRAVFQVTLHRLAVDAREAVHVGDDPLNDVLGAKAAGMRAVLLARSDPPPDAPQPDARGASLDEVARILDTIMAEPGDTGSEETWRI